MTERDDEKQAETRSHETVVDLEAPPEAVWRALTEAEEITRWFASEAKSTPGVGGSIWVRWWEGMEMEQGIEISDPPRHLRLSTPSGKPSPQKLATDFHLETREGGTTRLRIVASGFGVDASWDGLYHGTRKGWRLFGLTLKHYLERHVGRPRRVVNVFGNLAASCDEVFDAFTKEVEPVSAHRGETIAWVEPRLGDGFGTAEILPSDAGGAFVTVILSAFGDASALPELEKQWKERFEALAGRA